jgi:hypothetical protein
MKSFILPVELAVAQKYLLDIESFPSWSSSFLSCEKEGDKFRVRISASQLEENILLTSEVSNSGMKLSGTGEQLIRSFTLEWRLNALPALSNGPAQTKVEYEFSVSTTFPMPSFLKNTIENKFISQVIQDITAKSSGKI